MLIAMFSYLTHVNASIKSYENILHINKNLSLLGHKGMHFKMRKHMYATRAHDNLHESS